MENGETKEAKETKEAAKPPVAAKPKLMPVLRLLNESWEEYKVKFKGFMLIYWQAAKSLAIIAGVLLALLILSLLSGFLSEALSNVIRIAIMIAAFALAIYGGIYIMIRVQVAAYMACATDKVDSQKAFADSKKYFWGFFGLSLLTALVTMLWFCLLIIPGLIFSVLYAFVLYAFLFEDYRGWAALKRSQELVKGYFWPVLGRFLAIGAVSFILQLPASFFKKDSAGAGVYGFISMIISLLIQPLFFIYLYKIYYGLKSLKGESKLAKKDPKDNLWTAIAIILFLIIIAAIIIVLVAVQKNAPEFNPLFMTPDQINNLEALK